MSMPTHRQTLEIIYKRWQYAVWQLEVGHKRLKFMKFKLSEAVIIFS